MQIHIPDAKPEIKCPICTKKFYTDEGLKTHRVVHSKGPKLSEIQQLNANAIAKYLLCELCDGSLYFENWQDMTDHYQESHGKVFFARESFNRFFSVN